MWNGHVLFVVWHQVLRQVSNVHFYIWRWLYTMQRIVQEFEQLIAQLAEQFITVIFRVFQVFIGNQLCSKMLLHKKKSCELALYVHYNLLKIKNLLINGFQISDKCMPCLSFLHCEKPPLIRLFSMQIIYRFVHRCRTIMKLISHFHCDILL